MKKNYSLLLLLATLALALRAQDSALCYLRDDGGRIREHNVDFLKMKLTIALKPEEGKVIGKVQYEFRPIQYVVDTLALNAPGISVQSVLLNDVPVRFDTTEAELIVRFPYRLDWNSSYKLAISYTALPRKGMYFIGWNVKNKDLSGNPYATRKQIWTQGQGIDNRHWFPCYDDVNDKMLTETVITFDTAYTVISNGDLQSKVLNKDGTYTWHYTMNHPMAAYLVMVAIDHYAYKDYKSKNGIVSRQYYYRDRPETVVPTYRHSAEVMDFLAQELQVSYPWNTYANVPVQNFMYGAMENTTATIYGDFYLNDERSALERSYISTNAHELTHQWFGDYVSEYSAQHHWLQESFATYYAKQFLRRINGEDYYEAMKRDEANSAIQADKNNRFPVAHSQGGSARHYPKGSFVIDMLRYVVGDSVFRKTITHYLTKHAYANVTTHDLQLAFMETAGINLDWFFNEWLYRSGYPDFVVSYKREGDRVAFYVEQQQETDELEGYFKMPVFVEVHFKDGGMSVRKAWLSRQRDTIYVNVPPKKEIAYTLFDPASHLLKSMAFNKSFDELQAQFTVAAHMLDRFDALLALRTTAVNQKRDLLITHFLKGDYDRIQAEIIGQLADDTDAQTIAMLQYALHDKNFLVRRAVVEKLSSFPQALLPGITGLLSDSSYYTIEITLRKLCKLYPENTAQYVAQVNGVLGISGNVRIAALELQLKQTKNNNLQKELVDFASGRYEFMTRIKAIDALERLALFDEQIAQNLFDAVLYPNGRLRGTATRCLKTLLATPENKTLAKKIFEKSAWQEWQKTILTKVFE